MNSIADTVRRYGQVMGVENLAMGDNGLLCLDFESSGTLYLEYLERLDEVLVYLVRPMPAHDTRLAAAALELCRFRQEIPFTVQAGFMGDDRLVFMVRFLHREFTLPGLRQAIDLLKKRQENMVGR